MATSDLLLKDQSATPQSFAPESVDTGTNSAGTTIKRSMVGMADGANVTLGAKADSAWLTGSGSVIALLKAIAGFANAPVFGAGESHVGEVGGNSVVTAASFTRPANTTAYASGQLVANSTAAGSVAPIALAVARKFAGTGRVTRLRLSTSNASALNAVFRVHLFRTLPAPTVGDGGAFNAAGVYAVNGVGAVAIGSFTVTLDKAYSDGAKGIATPDVGAYVTFDAAAGSQTIYALIEARSAYTPASGETISIALEADRD